MPHSGFAYKNLKSKRFFFFYLRQNVLNIDNKTFLNIYKSATKYSGLALSG